jgi:hypothetical protein
MLARWTERGFEGDGVDGSSERYIDREGIEESRGWCARQGMWLVSLAHFFLQRLDVAFYA